jgi:hypothetical protein
VSPPELALNSASTGKPEYTSTSPRVAAIELATLARLALQPW